MAKIKEQSFPVSCRLPEKLFGNVKSLGRPGTIVTSMVTDFFTVKNHEASMENGTTVFGPDSSKVLTSHSKNQINLTVIKGDNIIVLDYDEASASHLVLKLNNLINQCK